MLLWDTCLFARSQEKAKSVVLKALDRQAALVEKDNARKKFEAAKREKELKARMAAEAARAKAAAAASAAAAPAATATAAAAPDADVVELSGDGSFDLDAAPAVAEGDNSGAPAEASTGPRKPDAVIDVSKAGDEAGDSKAQEPVDNGGVTDRYYWSQTLQDVTIYFPIPAGTRGKHITCDFTMTTINVGLKGKTPMLKGNLEKRIKPDDCYWTIGACDCARSLSLCVAVYARRTCMFPYVGVCAPAAEDATSPRTGRVIALYLQKENTMEWWKRVAEGEPEIDTQKVQPENSKLSDLDGDTRATVEKMMVRHSHTWCRGAVVMELWPNGGAHTARCFASQYDQRQKAMGLPTADEQKKQDVLKKFMAQHPEMDFSNAKIN